MRVFVFELLSAGGAGDKTPADALLCEGLAMLRAIAADFARCPACRVSTILDRRLLSLTLRGKSFDGIEVHWSDSADEERRLFRSLAADADATFVIAPETDGQLLERRRMVDACGGQFLGCSADCIALCGDKLRLYEHFDAVGLPTIATKLFDTSESKPPFNFPVVIKPRQGAGSQDTYLVEDLAALDALRPPFAAAFGDGDGAGAAIVQPFVGGRPLCASALVDSATGFAQVFPVGEQHLSDDSRFHYLGGRIPARGSAFSNVDELILTACRSIPGLSGYVGFDLIQLADSERFVIVEVNPRLTTSYLGYRELAVTNLASRILNPNRDIPLAWRAEPVTFRLPGEFASKGHSSVHPNVEHKALLHFYGEPAT